MADRQALVQSRANAVAGDQSFTFLLPSLTASSGGLPIPMVLRASVNLNEILATMEGLKVAPSKSWLFASVDRDLTFDRRAAGATIERSQANELGVTMKDIADTHRDLVGESGVNRFDHEGRS
ncbi:hypothetical protein [Burkholderia cenocepacia]|uniref:hypothetical protein n=1 Tax=Burkholderia cenocepacia TaxID=95486 RepID=UPI002230038C|nr:hypothetical protein [Burkholderia cenocepacia]MCW3610625.1 hypothetical protein [Burkholderia cenocepacia]MCW5191715.1 hypothetical protein [Burkholderia cenocepacia]